MRKIDLVTVILVLFSMAGCQLDAEQPTIKYIETELLLEESKLEKIIYNLTHHLVFVYNSADNTLLVLNAEQGQLLQSQPLPDQELIAWDFNINQSALYILTEVTSQNQIYRLMIDEQGNLQTPEPIAVDEKPTSIAAGADETLFYTTENSQGKTVFLQYNANNQQSETISKSDEKMAIVGRNHDATYIYVANLDSGMSVQQWNVKNDITAPENSAKLFGEKNTPSHLTQTTDDDKLLALTSSSAADNGVIPIYAATDLQPQGNLSLDWQPIALTLTADNSRAIAAHDKTVNNSSESNPHDRNRYDIHIFDMQQSDYPEIGHILLPSQVQKNGLIVTRDYKVFALLGGTDANTIAIITP